MAPRRRVTIRDVAAATGLSPAAVSYALRGVQTSEETQARVREAAESSATPATRSRGRSRAAGPASSACSPARSRTSASSASSRCSGFELTRRDLQMVIVDARGEPDRERTLARQLADQLVDGLIISPLDPSGAAWAEIGEALPVVTVGDALAGPTVGEVLFDNRAGVSMVLEHLHGLGHRRIAVLTPSRPSTPDRPAEIVVAEVCDALGLDATVVNSAHSIEAATASAAEVLARDPLPTAVFCLSDSIACGVYAAAAARGLAIPRELSVAGYDGHPIASVVAPPLTTVEWGMPDVAAAAAGLLAAALAGDPRGGAAARVRVRPRLLERGSTTAPAVVAA